MTSYRQADLHRMQDICLVTSVLLVMTDYYARFYSQFVNWALTNKISDLLMGHLTKVGLINNGRWLILIMLGMSFLGGRGRKDPGIRWQHCLILVGIGLVIFLSCELVGSKILYGILTTVGFILILMGGVRLGRIVPASFRGSDPFGDKELGFPQEERKLESGFSLNFRAQYRYRGEVRNSWVNVVNARRGILIIGSPGAGKSRFLIEPMIGQLMGKGMAMFIYDFKYDNLTKYAYNMFQVHRAKYSASATFFSINFSDLSRSHRCNLLDPKTLWRLSDALTASRTMMLSLNPTWVNRQGEFFVESPINFLAALIWYLRKYEGGRYCTLPHVIELAQVPYKDLFTILAVEPEISVLINPFVAAYKSKVLDMLESQVSSAKIPLGRLSSPDVYYVLSGNDCSLEINDPAAPAIFCLGGDPVRQEGLGPILSLYIDRLCQLVNRPGRYPCALVCDEFATMRAYQMVSSIMPLARSNNIVPVLAIQDISQLRTRYTHDEAEMVMNIAGNLFCGQVGGPTARWVSERFPRLWRERMSLTTNVSDTSISQSHQWEVSINPATVATLSSGEFLGVVTDDPGTPMELKAFHGTLIRQEVPLSSNQLPVIKEVNDTVIQEAFMRVKREIRELVDKEYARMMYDEALQGLIL